MSRGKFIVFEGIDGAGTTTAVAEYARHLKTHKRLVHVTREPSTGPIGALIRQALSGRLAFGAGSEAQTMALLFAADRLDHLEQEIEPHLRDGAVVLSDRYDLSSLAYQSATARNDASEIGAWIRSCNRFARRPDATVVIDVSPAVAEARRKGRSGAAELYEVSELQTRLCALYADAEKLVPGDRIVHIDGNRDLATVSADIRTAIDALVA
jgi:dTMP kinase